MLIEINEYDLEGKEMWNKDSYPSSGLYLINDGVTYQLVSVPSGNNMAPYGIAIPFEQVKKLIAKESAIETEKDIFARVYQRIADINENLEQMNEKIERSVLPIQQAEPTGNVSEIALLKAMAIVQKPDLALNLLDKGE